MIHKTCPNECRTNRKQSPECHNLPLEIHWRCLLMVENIRKVNMPPSDLPGCGRTVARRRVHVKRKRRLASHWIILSTSTSFYIVKKQNNKRSVEFWRFSNSQASGCRPAQTFSCRQTGNHFFFQTPHLHLSNGYSKDFCIFAHFAVYGGRLTCSLNNWNFTHQNTGGLHLMQSHQTNHECKHCPGNRRKNWSEDGICHIFCTSVLF